MAACKQMFNLTKLFRNVQLSSVVLSSQFKGISRQSLSIHTSVCRAGLMEFFDAKKNWGEKEVKVGRSWKVEELRIKSNTDLHKLWFVLLKEKNMLLTMEHAAKEVWQPFPNPERLDKVEESMENLETVVRERNRAYWQLEVGETGERPSRAEIAFTGLKYRYRYTEHRIPAEINTKFKKSMELRHKMDDWKFQKQWLSLWREKLWATRRRKRIRDFNHVCGLVKRFPNMDMEAVREQYPDVNIEWVLRQARSRGHRDNNTA